jgi:hypothetical protein
VDLACSLPVTLRSIVLPLSAAVALLGGAAGCGEDGRPSGRATTTAAQPGDFRSGTSTLLLVTFTRDGVTPDDPLRARSGATISLTVTSGDGRPHGLTVENAPRRPRAVVRPGGSTTIDLGVLPDGRYRLAPDGAEDPLTLVVG